ncbi:pyruvate formate-lyase-activating protein [Parasphaerochaeta coccoides]|uniref:Pyruvate formate-lyase-activating enzyme n=1 Tax=Parasphaerochaeta coccoides (strain ATCC BAA-1237 / DSM 17374 / SPN1) TaxID=760011 RepID=F4GIY3_PARC1|nr:pyruvate formate-lyase-activating protein [Parasphaerochaeta coccoides]AEC02751.1 pyruvate formate-lyase activating enzyme [Parasphaerochaeta coccoides DSM 17374]
MNREKIYGHIHSTESFGSVDGPGVRFIVFMQGCKMRCQFCHNPDTWKMTGGTVFSSEQLLAQAERFRPYWGKDGGITISGGEPLLQIDFLLDFTRKAKERGINIVLDTCGQPFTYAQPFFHKFTELMKYVDLILLDIKHIDDDAHKVLTGHSNSAVLQMARHLSDIGKPVWIRHVLVPQRTDYDEFLIRLDSFIETLSNVEKVEVLPYHAMGCFKWETLGVTYPLTGINPPAKERIENANRLLHTHGNRETDKKIASL